MARPPSFSRRSSFPLHGQQPSLSLAASSSSSSLPSPSTSTPPVTNNNNNQDDTDIDENADTTAHNSQQLQKYTNLLFWLNHTFPNSYIHPSIQIKKPHSTTTTSSPSASLSLSLMDGGYGTYTTQDICKNEVLFRIPREACITMTNVLSDADCGTQFGTLMERAGVGGGTVAMAGYIAKEYLLLLLLSQNNQKRKREGESSSAQEEEEEGQNGDGGQDDNNDEAMMKGRIEFAPYLQTLPWKRGVNGQEHVLFWSDEQVERYLKGSLSYEDAVGIRSEVKVAIQVLNGLIGPTIRKHLNNNDKMKESKDKNNGWWSFPWMKKNRLITNPRDTKLEEDIEEAITGAFVSLLTRSFQGTNTWSNGEEEERLVPLLDMLQHGNEPNVRHGTLEEDGSVQVWARCDLKAGDELVNQYREENEMEMPYHRFFTRFGFVPGVKESIMTLLEERNPIFFSQAEEV